MVKCCGVIVVGSGANLFIIQQALWEGLSVARIDEARHCLAVRDWTLACTSSKTLIQPADQKSRFFLAGGSRPLTVQSAFIAEEADRAEQPA